MLVNHADPYVPAIIDGISYRPGPVAYHGIDDHEFVWPGRVVVAGDWPRPRPEECSSTYATKWLRSGRILVCTGCGLDCS
jgi:hypothetical protein